MWMLDCCKLYICGMLWTLCLTFWDGLNMLNCNSQSMRNLFRNSLVYLFWREPGTQQWRLYIRFRLSDLTHEMNSSRFVGLLCLPSEGMVELFRRGYSRAEFWKQITCNAPAYISRLSKASYICNPILRYLQHLTANIVFPRCESQGVPQRGELFIHWAALHRIRINTAFHIVHHLDEQAKHSKGWYRH